ncbi:hypothetical protein TorRG33x02_130680 [Trema orientale]|uniref:Uncharacterized protein n=1 Tax=Trema orientale TaxID=63057 RepID=A0A2P5EZR8_TREOI|nr:hypothetical protein TorRG33x02_130680 [Trema orientale]
MPSPRDRYTFAFLLSSYGFNDYHIKPNQRFETHSSLSPRSRMDSLLGDSLLGDQVQDIAGSLPPSSGMVSVASPLLKGIVQDLPYSP